MSGVQEIKFQEIQNRKSKVLQIVLEIKSLICSGDQNSHLFRRSKVSFVQEIESIICSGDRKGPRDQWGLGSVRLGGRSG
jgi:hypothetical protein